MDGWPIVGAVPRAGLGCGDDFYSCQHMGGRDRDRGGQAHPVPWRCKSLAFSSRGAAVETRPMSGGLRGHIRALARPRRECGKGRCYRLAGRRPAQSPWRNEGSSGVGRQCRLRAGLTRCGNVLIFGRPWLRGVVSFFSFSFGPDRSYCIRGKRWPYRIL